MLEELGLRKFAYDWRKAHLPTFEDEILALRRHGIELTAYLVCVNLKGMTRGGARSCLSAAARKTGKFWG